MAPDKRDELYNNLINSGRVSENEIGTIDDFKAAITDEATAKEFHQNLLNSGIFTISDIGDAADFWLSIRDDFSQPTAATQPTAQQPTQRNMGTLGYVPNRFGIPTQQGMGPVADVAPHPMTPAQPLSFQERVQKSVGMAHNVGKAKADFSQRMSAIEQGNKPFSNGKAQQYDPTTGETKDVYYTTTGQAVSTPMERDVENIKNSPETKEREGKIKVREQIGDMTSEVGEALNQRGMELDDAALHNTLGDRPMGGGAMVHTFNSSTSNGRLSDERWRMLYAAKVAIDRANNMMREANTKGGIHNLGASEFVRGMGKVGNPDTWDMGLTEGVESTAMMVALQKADKGEELTREEQMLLDAKAVEMATAMFYASDLSGWYKAGEVTADALPFMLEMMINPAAKVGRSAQSMLTRYALKRFGKQALKRGGDKFVKGALRRFGGRAGIDLLGASYLTTTSSLPRVGADAISRMNGDVQFNTNEEGNIQYAGHTKGEDWWNAWSKGYLSTLTENYSEMLGEYFAPLFKWLGKGIGRGATSLADTKFGKWLHLGGGIDKVEDFIKGVSARDAYKFISDLEENAQWHGILGEYAEEVVGGIMNAILVGDQTLDADPDTGVFNLKKNLETLQGVAVMGGFFSAMKTVGYRNPAHVARRAMRKADRAGASAFGEQWESIRSMIDGGQSDAFDDTWDGMTDSQKQAILEYTKAAYTYKGIAEGKAKRDAEGIQTMQEAAAEQSYNTGYDDATTDELRSDINMAYTDARQTLVGLIGEDAVNEIDSDPLAMQAQYDQDMTVDDNTKSAIADYVSAKSAWDGVQQRISDDAADRADQRRAEGEKMAYKGKGNMQGAIRPLTINEESKEVVVNPQTGKKERKKKTVYLVNGNIAIEPNGNGLSREGTDKTIYVYDPETGDTHELDPFAGAGVLSVGDVVSMEDYLADNEQQSQAEVQQAAETAQGKVKVNTPFETPQGRKGVVQSIEGDNAIVLFADGEMEQASMPLAEVQQYADALRRKEYEARHPQQNQPQAPAEQPQQPNTATEGQNTVGAEVAAEYLLGSGANAINSTDYLLKALSGIFRNAQSSIEAIRLKYQQQFVQQPYADIDNFVNSDLYEQIVGEVRNAINAAYSSNSIEAQSILDEILKSPKGLPNRTGQDISRRVESLNAQQTPTEGENATADTRTPAQRTYDDVVAKLGADRASKKIDATAKVKADRLSKAQKALKTAQEAADNTEYGSKEEQKAEEAVVKAQAEYDAAQQDMAAWEEVRKLRDQALLAQAEQEEQQRKAELERKRAAETEAQRKQREEYETEQARRKAEAEAAEKRRQEENERLRQQAANPQPAEQPAPIEGTKGQASQLTIARQELEGDPESLAMLDETTPRTLVEVAATLLASGKNATKLLREDFKRETGYSDANVKRYPFLFAGADKGGITLARFGEMVVEAAREYGVQFDENDATAGIGAALELLGSVGSQADINDYIINSRIAEAYDYHNAALAAARANKLEAYGMTEGEYEAYMSWLEDAIEQGKSTLSDEEFNQIFNVYEQGQETDVARGNQESTETTERTESAETDVSQNGERGNGETDAGTGEQAAVSKYEEAESAFFGFLEWTNWEYGTNYDWNSLMSFLKWANKKAKAKDQPLRIFVRAWIGDKYPPKDAAELTDKIFAALKEREEAKKTTAQQPKEEAEGGTETAPQPVGGATAQGETPAAEGKETIGELNEKARQRDLKDAVTAITKCKTAYSPQYRERKQRLDNLMLSVESAESREDARKRLTEFLNGIRQQNPWLTDEVIENGKPDATRAEDGLIAMVADLERAVNKSYSEKSIERVKADDRQTDAINEILQRYYDNEPIEDLLHNADDEVLEGVRDGYSDTEDTNGEKRARLEELIDAELGRRKQTEPTATAQETTEETPKQETPKQETKPLTNNEKNWREVVEVGVAQYSHVIADNVEHSGFEFADEIRKAYDTSNPQAKAIVQAIEQHISSIKVRPDGSTQYKVSEETLEREEQPKQEPKAEKEETTEPKEPKRLISDEQMDELKERLRKKLRGQLNSGFDPEIIEIGLYLAVGHIERGLTKFADFAKRMIEDLGDAIRPYLKSFYNGARDFPGAEKLAEQMTPYEEVRAFDVENFDKARPSSIIDTAKEIAAEQEIEKEVEKIKKRTKGNKKEDSTLSNTEQGQLDLFGNTETPNNNENNTDTDRTGESAGTEAEPTRLGENETRPNGGLRQGNTENETDGGNVGGQPNADGGTDEDGESRPTAAGVSGNGGKRDTATDPNSNVQSRPVQVIKDPQVEQGDVRTDNHSPLTPKEKNTPKNTRNYLYPAEAGEIDNYTPSERMKTNLAALEVLRTLIRENREATPDERATMGKLRGWGGINIPDEYRVRYRSWELTADQSKLVDILKELDPNGELKLLDSLRTAAHTSYYTPIAIAKAMHGIAELAGYKGGGSMLDPSMGNGVFEGTMKKGIQQSTQIRGVELDWLTGQIARRIYPDAKINITGVQDAHIPENRYDYVVSNIPFGNLKIVDLDWEQNLTPIRKAASNRIHNYFAVKMIESTRKGGVCMIMTSNAIMDTNGNAQIREYIADNCEILGCIRLPNNTFKGAGTRVVTDVIVLRKFKDESDRFNVQNNEEYANRVMNPFRNNYIAQLKDDNGIVHEVTTSGYYNINKKNVIGEPKAGGQYSDDAYDLSSDLTTEQIAEQISKIGKRFMEKRKELFGAIVYDTTTPKTEIAEAVSVAYKGNGRYESAGNIVIQDGNTGKLQYVKEGNSRALVFTAQQFSGATNAQVSAYTELRTLLKELITYQIEGNSEEIISGKRAEMQQAYKAYTDKYGQLQSKKNYFIEDDIDGFQVRALEKWKNGKFVGMADIFTKNTIKGVENIENERDPQKAVLNSLSMWGKINTDYLQRVLGDKWFESCKGMVFEDPSNEGTYVPRDLYLTGDVVSKLEYAKLRAAEEKKWQDNVDELEKVQPRKKEFGEFPCHLGARWVPVEVYNDFLTELFDVRSYRRKSGIVYNEANCEYVFNLKDDEFGGKAAEYRTNKKSASEIFEAALLDRDIVIYNRDDDGKVIGVNKEATEAARDKVQMVRDAFEDWVVGSQERVKKLTDTYNSIFNRFVLPTYNGQHLNVVGLQGITLRPHQKDAIWRIINQRGGIIDHIVGAGKSLVMMSSIMEMRRMGVAKKPMIVALKATTAQIAKEFREAFPTARVLAPDEKDFSVKNRKKFLAQIAVNDYDCIILSHEQYSGLDHSDDVKREFIEDQINQLDNLIEYLYGQEDITQLTKKQIKGLEKRRANLQEKLKKLELIKTDEEFVFENLGVDYLFVDECQAFKNLMFQTSYGRVAGLGNPEGSERSTKLLYGIRSLQKLHQGDMGTVFLSGTTISNSLSELYNIFNYLRPNEMRRMGLNTFDAWASTFAVRSSEAEFGVTNELKEKSRFRKFEGLQELSRLYTEIADVRNDSNLELPKPKTETHFVAIPISDTMKMINDQIVKMVNNQDGDFFGIHPEVKDKYPWSLAATNLAKKATLTPKLISTDFDDENGKIFHVCENVAKIYRKFDKQKGVQLIFCDAGVPDSKKEYDAYTDIITRLTEQYGIPSEEIVDIHEANNADKRQELFARVNNGDVRILIGGTKNMGTGVNVQKRVVAMHHLDIPWTPADVAQRNGRGARQGNEIARDYNDNKVDTYYYAVEQTLDTYRYQLQDVKGKMIDNFKTANVGLDEFDEGGDAGEDGGAMNPAEMVAILSGNPIILDKAKQDKIVDKLNRLKRSSVMEYARRKEDYAYKMSRKKAIEEHIKNNAKDIERLKRNGFAPNEKGEFPPLRVIIDGKEYEKATEAGKAIYGAILQNGKVSISAYGMDAKVNTYEVESTLFKREIERDLTLETFTGIPYRVQLSENETAAGQAMQNLLKKVYSTAEVYARELETINHQLEGAEVGEYVFAKQAELDAAIKRKREIDDEYNKLIKKDDEQQPKADPSTDSDVRFRGEEGEDVRFRLREDEEPTKTGTGYKVFVLKDGKLYPPMVANPNGEATPVGVWLDADAAPVVGESKTGRPQVKAGGKGTQGGSGQLAYRPGWHLGTIPYALQFNRKNPETGEKDLFPANFVWAEVDYANDIDYQDEARAEGMNASGKYQHSLAGLKRVPVNGSYMYRTNPDPNTDPWIITGAMRVRRILKPSEVDEMVRAAGREPQKRQEGAITDAQIDELNDKINSRLREGGEEAYAGEWYDRNSVERIGEFAGYTPKQIAKMNARQEQTARNKFRDAAEKLHLSDNITFADTIDDVPGLTDKQRKEWRRKKGWYSPRTGKIVIILGNHKSMDDVTKSILHEGVAHHGLRQLFGEHFNTFLDNVYKAASPEIRDRINTMAKKHGWDFREATEEYLAMLAEDTEFERPENQSWWKQVKAWFIDLLHKIGFKLNDAYDTITDNELRYILWRSYQNLVNPGRFNSVVEEAKDIAKQYDLKVGEWDETWTVAAEAEPNATMEFNGRRVPIWATNGRREDRSNGANRSNGLSLADFEKNMRGYQLGKNDTKAPNESVIHNNAYWRAVHYLEDEKVTLADAKAIAEMVADEILTSTDSVRLEELQGMYDALMPWIEHREEEEREMAADGVAERPAKWNNRGYTTRENGQAVSVRGLQAEEEGRFPKGTFMRVNHMPKETFDSLKKIGAIESGEWHHTGKAMNKTPYFGWLGENEDAEAYAQHKAEIDKICQELGLKEPYEYENGYSDFFNAVQKAKSRLAEYLPSMREDGVAEDAAEYAQRDAEYMEAVNSGDMEKAQRMVNEAAKRAMPDTKVVDENGNPLVVYHGTQLRNPKTEGAFYVFHNNSHFGTIEQAEERIFYPLMHNEYTKTYSVFLNIKNLKRVNDIPKGSEINHSEYWNKEISKAKEEGYDGLIYTNVWEGKTYDEKGKEIYHDSYISFYPNQIKSADPVTYDDNGNVIPLSQRFNEGSDDIRFRDGEEEETGAPKAQARGAYERMVSSAASQWKEAMQDSMLSLKKLYQAVSQAYKGSTKGVYRIEDEKGYENAYLAENRMHSMSEAQIHAYQQDYMKPLQRAIRALTGGKREAYETLTDYMMAKHGLERNEVMAKREAKKAWEEKYKSEQGNPNYTAAKNAAFANIDAGVDDLYLEYRKQDYAGLTALTGIEDVEEAEKESQRMVDEYEQQHDTADLWIATNRATRRSLFKMLESGLLSPQRHAEIRDMYQYYIPLQGFDSDVAEDVYAYMGSDGTRLYGTTIRAAKGRKSKADDPIATIAMNGEAAIRRGNRNLMKQHFLRFVQSHPSDLVSINDVWLRKNSNGEWEQYFDADLKETDTPEEVARKVRDFNERMEQEAAANPDIYKRSRELPNVPFRVLNVRDMEQHQVMVQVDGKNCLLTINGNPRAAQALNGLTNPDVFTEGAFGSIMNATQSVVRTLSQFYTTRNPNFVLSNFLRDAVYTNSMVLAKESPNYALNFHKNFLLLPNERMGVLFASWENGKLREKLANGTASNMEKMFYDFMMNGGETGWTSLRDIEKHKRDLQKALKREGNIAASALNKLGDFFDITNRMIENHARFTAYVTSIEMGRSVERAVWDAKEISVNFNKKGAGDKFLKAKNQTFVGKVGAFVSGLGRGNYAFWNASLQGLNNIARIGKRNPAKFMAVATTLMGLGVAIPLLNALLGGDDDDDKNAYWNLPEYVRRSNICFRFTKDMPWITIPLPIEFRAIYGLGELGSGVALGKEHYSKGELTKQVAAQFSQVLPLDFMEGGGGWHCIYPTYVKPVIEAYSNQSWTGLPIYRKNTYGQYDVAPEWQRAYSNTNNQIMAATKWLNEATGGDEVQGGNIDLNPARIEYMLRGYLGGYFTVADQVIKMGETATGNREFEWRNMMLANRVVKEGDERTEARKLTNEYFNLKEEYDKTDKSLKAYKKKQDEGTLSVVGQAHYIALMNDSEEYGRYLVFGTYKPLFDAYYKQIKEANAAGDSEEAKRLERGQNELRREMVNIIHDMDNGGTFDRKKVATGINENLKKMQNDKLWDAQDKAINKSIEADNALNPTDNVEE